MATIYPDLDYYNQDFHIDHIHPASIFRDKNNIDGVKNIKLREYMSNESNWNSILNLQLLNGDLNRSKQASSLEKWSSKNNVKNKELLLDEEISLRIEDFREFIENRKINLAKKMKDILAIS